MPICMRSPWTASSVSGCRSSPQERPKASKWAGCSRLSGGTSKCCASPGDIPDVIELDITDLDMGDSIHIEDIAMENIEFSAEVNFTVLTVLSPKGKEEEEGEEGEEEEAETEAEA